MGRQGITKEERRVEKRSDCMKMKKLKQKNFVRLLGVCSFLIAMIAMVGTILMPTSSKADAVHYLRPYQSTNATIYDGVAGKSFQMAGTQYSRGITSGQRYSTMDAEFYLGGQVSSVSFTLGHLDNQDHSAGTFKLYLDEEIQEDYTKALSYDMPNQTVTVNTTGKMVLQIIIEGDYARYGMANITMSSGHNYVAEVTKIATVQDSGSVTYTCKDCGHTYQETIPARTNCIDYLSPYQCTNMTEYKEEMGSTSYVTCMGDKKYRCLKTGQRYSSSNALYSLNGGYKSVTFMIGHIDNDGVASGTLNIYVDGNQIKQEKLYRTMYSKNISIDTTNVTQLKLEVTGDYARYVIYDFVATPKVESPKAHSFHEETLTEATFGVAGVIRHVCSVCGAYYTTNTEPGTRNMTDSKISVTLEQTDYIYSGKPCEPVVKVEYDGTALTKDKDYAVQYSNHVAAGTGQVTVVGLGYYKGQTSVKFNIFPKKTTISSIKNKKRRKAVVKWKKNSQADGYEVVYTTSYYFYAPSTKAVGKKTSATLSRLTKGCTYYVKVRAYKEVDGTRIYGDYGKTKKIKIKK